MQQQSVWSLSTHGGQNITLVISLSHIIGDCPLVKFMHHSQLKQLCAKWHIEEPSHWWASSSDTLIYPSIFAFLSLSLHRWSTTTHLHSDATAHTRARTTITLTPSDRSRLFDGHMTYDSHVFTSILSVSNVPPPAVQPIMSSHTTRSGTFYNFALCSHSCLPFVFNLPVFYLLLRTSSEMSHTIAYTSFPQNWDFAPSRTYFALFRIASHCHNPTISTCHNTPGDNPLPPDRTPSEPHRIYT